jgi:hypothetical protein
MRRSSGRKGEAPFRFHSALSKEEPTLPPRRSLMQLQLAEQLTTRITAILVSCSISPEHAPRMPRFCFQVEFP